MEEQLIIAVQAGIAICKKKKIIIKWQQSYCKQFRAGNHFILCWNLCFMKSADHGFLATADAMGAQATECFGKENVARLVF